MGNPREKNSRSPFCPRRFSRGNPETRTLRFPKTLKSKSSRYCLMPSVISTVFCRRKKLSCFGVKNRADNNQNSVTRQNTGLSVEKLHVIQPNLININCGRFLK